MTRTDLMTEAGLAGLVAESGAFDRLEVGTAVPVPSTVELVDGVLRWERQPTDIGHTDKATFDAFLRLGQASDERLLAFVRRYGVLMGTADERGHGDACNTCVPPGMTNLTVAPYPRHGSEPAETIRRLARDAQRCVRIASYIHRDTAVPPALWAELENFTARPFGSRGVIGLRHTREHVGAPFLDHIGENGPPRAILAYIASTWLRNSGVGLEVAWTDAGPSITYVASHLFSALGLSFVQVVTGRPGIAMCSYCSATYTPKRKPRPDRANFCPQCQSDKVSAKLATARYRSK